MVRSPLITRLLLGVACGATLPLGCSRKDDVAVISSEPAPSSAPPPVASQAAPSPSVGASAPPQNDPSHHAALLAIADKYRTFSRVDGTWWSKLDCRAPPDDPGHMSSAADGTPHGRKVFTLQIYDFDVYAKETGGRPPPPESARVGKGPPVPGIEQALVKVSYEPTEDPAKVPRIHQIAPVTHQGKRFYAGEQKDLFIMYRPMDKTAATDAGWLYGTVTPDGKKVTSSGLVNNCMGCHEKAPHGRQFGVR